MFEGNTPSPTETAEGAAAGDGAPLDRAEPSAVPADDSPKNDSKGTSAGTTPSAAMDTRSDANVPSLGDAEGEDPFAGMSEKERAFWDMMSRAKESPRYQACGECDGLGHVRTGSQVGEEFALIACEGCAGKGYVARPATGVNPVFPVVQGDPPAPGMVFDPQRGIWAYPGT